MFRDSGFAKRKFRSEGESAEGGAGIRADGRPLRALVINDHLGYAGGVTHGATTYLLATLREMDPSRVRPVLRILSGRHATAEQFEAAGIDLICLGRGKWDPRVLVDLVRAIRQYAPDILHLNGMKGMLLGRIAGRITGCPAILHFHDASDTSLWLRLLQGRVMPWPERALAVSGPIRDFAIETFGLPASRIEVLHNGVDIDRMGASGPDARARIRQELDIGANAPVVGVVGRMVPEKGHEKAIRAMPTVLTDTPDAVLLVVGDGPAGPECARLAEELGLGAAVRFAGYRSDVPDLLEAMDVVSVPSVWIEAFPYVVLEAMVASLPVVAYRTGGLPEMIGDGETGLLVPGGDVAALAAALSRMLKDPELRRRLGNSGRRRVENFTVAAHARRLEKIYAEIARPDSGGAGCRSDALALHSAE